jgi:hypothetical protein
MTPNARRRPLVTDGASGNDQLRSKISPSNSQSRRGLQLPRIEITRCQGAAEGSGRDSFVAATMIGRDMIEVWQEAPR